MKKWYVFDEYDCIDSFDTVVEAAAAAQRLVDNEFTGVEIRYLSLGEFSAYCHGGEKQLKLLRDKSR